MGTNRWTGASINF